MSARGRRAGTVVAAGLLVLGGLGGCSASNDDGGRDRATTTREGAGPSDTSTTTGGVGEEPPPGPDPAIDDVSDATFDGLGDPRIDVLSYDVVVTAEPEDPLVTGEVAISLSALTTDPLPSFTLDLRGPRIDDVTVDDEPAEVTVDGAEVTIEPAEPLAPGEESRVEVRYHGEPDQTSFPALGVPVGWQPDTAGGWFTMSEPDGTSTWVPVSDHPSDKATWSITLDTPDGVTGVANGHLASRESAGGRTRWAWEHEQPMATYLVLAAIGDYELVDHEGPDGIDVTFAFPSDLSDARREGFEDTDDILAFFADTFGAYPFADAGAIVVDTELGVALENQTRPMFGTDSVYEGEVYALAHELAHQWFGDDVTLATWPDLWLNEGFAVYADWLYQDHTGEEDIDDQARATAESYQDVALAVRDPLAAGTFDLVVYERGALTLHALRLEVGDDVFFAILRRWVEEHGGRTGSTEELVAIASDEAGRDLAPFLASWLDTTPQPDLPG